MKNLTLVVLIGVFLLAIGYFVKQQIFDSSGNVNSTDYTDTTSFTSSTLDLSGEGLTQAPGYIFNRTNILALNLSHNRMTGALQSQLGQLKNLKFLDLSFNQFTGVPAEIGQLKNLEVVNLSHNEITGLPNELGNLTHLKVLDLTGNLISPVDLASIKRVLGPSVDIRTD